MPNLRVAWRCRRSKSYAISLLKNLHSFSTACWTTHTTCLQTAQVRGLIKPMALPCYNHRPSEGFQGLSKMALPNVYLWASDHCGFPIYLLGDPILSLHLSKPHSPSVTIHSMDSAARLPKLESLNPLWAACWTRNLTVSVSFIKCRQQLNLPYSIVIRMKYTNTQVALRAGPSTIVNLLFPPFFKANLQTPISPGPPSSPASWPAPPTCPHPGLVWTYLSPHNDPYQMMTKERTPLNHFVVLAQLGSDLAHLMLSRAALRRHWPMKPTHDKQNRRGREL